jgi:hypothetical protein
VLLPSRPLSCPPATCRNPFGTIADGVVNTAAEVECFDAAFADLQHVFSEWAGPGCAQIGFEVRRPALTHGELSTS